jgi:hypothetical protein
MIEILVLTAVIVGLSFTVLYFMQKSIVDESDPEIKKYKNDTDGDKDASYSGNSSGYSKIRICEGASSYSIAYFIDDNKVYNACTSIYDAEYTIEGNRVYKEGSVAYTVDGNKIYRGTDICSENIVYTIDGNNILRGTGSYPAEIVYNIIYE